MLSSGALQVYDFTLERSKAAVPCNARHDLVSRIKGLEDRLLAAELKIQQTKAETEAAKVARADSVKTAKRRTQSFGDRLRNAEAALDKATADAHNCTMGWAESLAGASQKAQSLGDLLRNAEAEYQQAMANATCGWGDQTAPEMVRRKVQSLAAQLRNAQVRLADTAAEADISRKNGDRLTSDAQEGSQNLKHQLKSAEVTLQQETASAQTGRAADVQALSRAHSAAQALRSQLQAAKAQLQQLPAGTPRSALYPSASLLPPPPSREPSSAMVPASGSFLHSVQGPEAQLQMTVKLLTKMWGQAQARAQDLERCQLRLRLTEQQLSDRGAGPQVYTKIQQGVDAFCGVLRPPPMAELAGQDVAAEDIPGLLAAADLWCAMGEGCGRGAAQRGDDNRKRQRTG